MLFLNIEQPLLNIQGQQNAASCRLRKENPQRDQSQSGDGSLRAARLAGQRNLYFWAT